MNFQYSPYGVVLILSAIIVLYLAIYSYKKRSSSLHTYFILLMASVFLWCFGSAMEFFSVEIGVKIFWIKFSYLGVATAAHLWLIFVLKYVNYGKYLKARYFTSLFLIPAFVLIMAFTNEWHGLLWPSITPTSNIPGSFLIYEHGPVFWISIIYSFGIILSGIVILSKVLLNYPSKYRNQIYFLLFSGLVPLIFSIFYTESFVKIPGLDITPFAFTISGILLAISIFRYRFLDIIPLAYNILFKNMVNGFLVFDYNDKLIEVNKAVSLINVKHSDIGKSAKEVLNTFPEILSLYESLQPESEIYLNDPVNQWIQVQISPIYDNNLFHGKLILIQDINERKSVEKELSDSEERYRVLTELSPDAVLVVIDRKIIFANKSTLKLLDAENIMEVIGKDILSFIHEDFREISKKRLHEVYVEKKPLDFLEEKIITLKGEIKDIEVGDVPIIYNNQLAIQLVIRDITERKKLEEELKKSLNEKDLMMKEIHHRVKNNLMIIQSLLQLQSRYIKDEDALNIFRESQNRAKSMALIHQRLYQSENLKRIDFGDYTKNLVIDLFRSYSANSNQIKLHVDVDNETLDINTAIPLGLILNELVSNSLKHGFLDGKEGHLNVEFHLNSKYRLMVCDDGIGIPEGLNHENTDSLGLMLIYSLSDQIGAEIKLDRSNGTRFDIEFEEQY